MCFCAPTSRAVAAHLDMKGANAADVFGEMRERKNKS